MKTIEKIIIHCSDSEWGSSKVPGVPPGLARQRVMLPFGHQLQIVRMVILSVAINMVNYLKPLKMAIQLFGQDMAMLVNPLPFNPNPKIPAFHQVSPLAVLPVPFPWVGQVFHFAFLRTEFSFMSCSRNNLKRSYALKAVFKHIALSWGAGPLNKLPKVISFDCFHFMPFVWFPNKTIMPSLTGFVK